MRVPREMMTYGSGVIKDNDFRMLNFLFMKNHIIIWRYLVILIFVSS